MLHLTPQLLLWILPDLKYPEKKDSEYKCVEHTTERTAGEQRARLANLAGVLPQTPDQVQWCSRCKEQGHNTRHCRALPPGL